MILTEPDPIQINGSVTNALCYGDNNGAVDANVIGGTTSTSGYVYLWDNNATSEDLSNVTAGSYTLTVTDNHACVETRTFTVTEPDELEAIIAETSPFVLELSSVTGGVPSYTYLWYESGTQVGSGTSYIVSSYGTYYLEVTDDHNCVAQSNSETYLPSAIVDAQEVLFRVYPNPFRDEATVDFGYTVKEATLSIVDIYGKLIEQHEITNSDSFVISSKDKASGIYFLKMETSSRNMFVKLIIE
jgi:hypothetical protein